MLCLQFASPFALFNDDLVGWLSCTVGLSRVLRDPLLHPLTPLPALCRSQTLLRTQDGAAIVADLVLRHVETGRGCLCGALCQRVPGQYLHRRPVHMVREHGPCHSWNITYTKSTATGPLGEGYTQYSTYIYSTSSVFNCSWSTLASYNVRQQCQWLLCPSQSISSENGEHDTPPTDQTAWPSSLMAAKPYSAVIPRPAFYHLSWWKRDTPTRRHCLWCSQYLVGSDSMPF